MSAHLIIWVCILTLSFTIGIIQIVALYGFYSIQHLVIINKRYPKLVMIEAVAVIFLCLIVIPFWYNILLDAVQFNGYEGFHLIGWLTIAPTNHLIANIEACRCWLISYNLHYLHSSKNKKWKSEIDHSFAEKNWYLLNKNKYGNRNFVISRVLIYYVIAAVVSTSCFLYFQFDTLHLSELIDGLLFSVPVAIAIITYFKCPKHNESEDNFYFHYEIKTITIIYLSCFIFYFSTNVVQYLGFGLLHTIGLLSITVYGILLPSLVSTLWIPRKILMNKTWKRDHVQPFAKINSAIVVMNKINADIQNEQETSLEKMKKILADEDKFELFVHWMYREFSSENILCFIELVQYKHYLINIAEKQCGERIECEYILYDNVPKSTIIYSQFAEEEESTRHKKMAHELYKKYIQVYSQFEVNISSLLRNKYRILDQQKWNKEVKDMIHIFDDVIYEMVTFMWFSFVRFEGCNV